MASVCWVPIRDWNVGHNSLAHLFGTVFCDITICAENRSPWTLWTHTPSSLRGRVINGDELLCGAVIMGICFCLVVLRGHVGRENSNRGECFEPCFHLSSVHSQSSLALDSGDMVKMIRMWKGIPYKNSSGLDRYTD